MFVCLFNVLRIIAAYTESYGKAEKEDRAEARMTQGQKGTSHIPGSSFLSGMVSTCAHVK